MTPRDVETIREALAEARAEGAAAERERILRWVESEAPLWTVNNERHGRFHAIRPSDIRAILAESTDRGEG